MLLPQARIEFDQLPESVAVVSFELDRARSPPVERTEQPQTELANIGLVDRFHQSAHTEVHGVLADLAHADDRTRLALVVEIAADLAVVRVGPHHERLNERRLFRRENLLEPADERGSTIDANRLVASVALSP